MLSQFSTVKVEQRTVGNGDTKDSKTYHKYSHEELLQPPWFNQSLPSENRTRALITSMSPDEKMTLLSGIQAVKDNIKYEGHTKGIDRVGVPQF